MISAEAVSAIVAVVALYAGWVQWRKVELRKEDTLSWSNDVIEVLQTLVLICSLKPDVLAKEVATEKLLDVTFRTSILVERGRLLFKNIPGNRRNKNRQPAYRGTRPLILDQLIIAHQIAQAWGLSDESAKAKLCVLAEDCKQTFVSLAQTEVGRDRTASSYTKKAGEGVMLDDLMEKFDESRLL